MNWRKITGILILITTLLLVIYDVFVATKGDGTTISEVIRDYAHRNLIVAFGSGVLCGHWFWTPSK